MQPPNPYGQQPQGNSYPQQQPPNPYGQQPPGNPYGQYPPVNRYPQQPPANPYGQQPQANPYPQHSQPHGQRPRSGISRRRVIFGLTALGVVAAGGLVWWSTRSGSFSLPPAFAYTHTGNNGIVFQVAWSPDGKRIAEASASLAGSPQDGAVTIQVWDADNGGNVAFYGREHGGAHSVSWSPDGKHIVSENLGTIQVWDVDSGKVVYTPDKEFSGQCFKAAWSPDGKRIASGGYDDFTVQVWQPPS